MKIKTEQRISFSKLRNLCIKKNWYTCGTVTQYSKMLEVTDKENVTSEDIYNTAIDIIEHSNLEEYAKSCGMATDSSEFIECIMYEIGCLIDTFYTVEE